MEKALHWSHSKTRLQRYREELESQDLRILQDMCKSRSLYKNLSNRSKKESIDLLVEARKKSFQVPRRVLLLGDTGSGKSTLGNFLLTGRLDKGTEPFATSGSYASQTKICEEKEGYYLGDENNIKICVCDTPGINDSDGKCEDEQNFDRIREHINNNAFHAILLVVSNARMDGALRRLMSLVSEAMMEGEDKTLTRLCIIRNQFSLGTKELRARERFLEQAARDNLHAMVQEAVGSPIMQRQLQAEAQKHWYKQQLKAFLQRDGGDGGIHTVPAHVVESLCQQQMLFLDCHYIYSDDETEKKLSRHQFEDLHEWLSIWSESINFRIPQTIRFHDLVTIHAQRILDWEKQRQEERKQREKDKVKYLKQREIQMEKISHKRAVKDLCCARLSAEIYREQKDFKENLEKEKKFALEYLHVEQNPSLPSFAILRKDQNVIVVFRGTPNPTLSEICSNFVIPTSSRSIGSSKQHQVEMHDAYSKQLYVAIREKGADYHKVCHELIAEKLEKMKFVRLVYCGHSDGGALALACAALHLSTSIKADYKEVVTFGAPLVLGKGMTEEALKPLEVRNYVYGSDFIPRLLRLRNGSDSVTPMALQGFIVDFAESKFTTEYQWSLDMSSVSGIAVAGSAMAVEGFMASSLLFLGGGALFLGAGAAAAQYIHRRRVMGTYSTDSLMYFLDKAGEFGPCGKTITISVDESDLSTIPMGSVTSIESNHRASTYVSEVEKLTQINEDSSCEDRNQSKDDTRIVWQSDGIQFNECNSEELNEPKWQKCIDEGDRLLAEARENPQYCVAFGNKADISYQEALSGNGNNPRIVSLTSRKFLTLESFILLSDAADPETRYDKLKEALTSASRCVQDGNVSALGKKWIEEVLATTVNIVYKSLRCSNHISKDTKKSVDICWEFAYDSNIDALVRIICGLAYIEYACDECKKLHDLECSYKLIQLTPDLVNMIDELLRNLPMTKGFEKSFMEIKTLQKDSMARTSSLMLLSQGRSHYKDARNGDMDMNAVCDALVAFRSGIEATAGLCPEIQAELLSEIGKVYEEIFHFQDAAQDAFSRCKKLADGCYPQVFCELDWYQRAEQALKQEQMDDERSAEDARFLMELAPELKVLKQHNKCLKDVLKFVIERYQPKGIKYKEHAGDAEKEDDFYMEMLKNVLGALHNAKDTSNKDQVRNQQITLTLLQYIDRHAKGM
ncbi:hypothetical protein GUITHDRAFT_137067 [Guillardia theta CCMP2712]|uniref:Fungal lipase-like domain-containing protein n=1 Tax=Guillardia theta (strain CCMP2712) TaxID=905079 RepID=L1JIH3_GUITC|nr:hypothetical protein GUITHDRAFT_137067 [Guillardia theta CCMP2712]EKX48132.1 hypothetical protein GUITHDRAFT_137067 [Guillardia theta CCMP2712]|eukprot:XP_005835112.1 hypothetical protein GUITHDRAFT_137067 [Guillardia theta CCMP2712]